MTTTKSRPTLYEGPSGGTWFDFLLLAFMLTNLAWSLASAAWSPGLEQLFPVVIMAVVAGTVVARSPFGELFATLYSLMVGTATILFNLARLAPEGLVNQERVYHILERVWAWLLAAFSPEPLADNLAFVMVLALLVWILGFSAAWAYFREGRKWQSIIPTGLAMLVNLYYAPPHLNIYFVLYLFCAILLVVRATLHEREFVWRHQHIFYPFDIGFDFMRDAVLLALFVIITAWGIPSAAAEGKIPPLLDPLQKPWHRLQEEWDQLFSTINYNQAVGVPTFGASLALGGPRNVTDALVMDVKTPYDRYYRAVVYDTYLPGGWVLQQSQGIHLATSTFTLPAYAARRVITQTITTYLPGSVLLAAPQPLAVALPADARVLALAEAQNDAPPQVELAMLLARNPLKAGDSYVVRSAIAVPTVRDLRNAGEDYPPIIGERYLQLPDSVPQRVFDLAAEIAGDEATPYDKAKALERYLRGIPYNDQIPGPAPGQDAVDYFLFQEKQGYCNYYATAMAVMLRHLGVPARIAVGYATGEYQEATGLYRIRDKDAHTWVEVYFPRYGWVEFEPTASEPVLQRPSGAEDTTGIAGSGLSAGDENPDKESRLPQPDEPVPLGEQPATAGRWLRQNGGLLLFLATLAAIGAVIIWSARSLRPHARRTPPRIRVVPPDFIERMWSKTLGWSRRLHLPPSPTLTPFEQAERLSQVVPEAAEPLHVISDYVARARYARYQLSPQDAGQAQLSWWELRAHLWRAWLRRILGKKRKPS